MAGFCIQTDSLCKRYGRRVVVDHINLTVEPGQTFGFLGPNGAGKSTTIRMLLGLVSPSHGRASLFGHDIRHQRLQALRRVGAMVESPSFYPFLSARANVSYFGQLAQPVSPAEAQRVLDVVGLSDRADDKVKTFSHGMKQRLGIACALVNSPDLVVLDEPTNGLDPEGVSEVRDLVRQLASQHGMSVFLSSHLLHEVEQVCTNVGVIAKGKMLVSGPVNELLRQGGGVLEVVVSNADAAADILTEAFQKEPLQRNSGSLVVELDHEQGADYLALLVERGVRVFEVRRRQQSLEDYYLNLVRGEQSEH